MTNDECQMTKELRMTNAKIKNQRMRRLELRVSSFFRHLAFVIRHLPRIPFKAFGDDIIHFLLGQLGEHWQRDASRGVLLRVPDRAVHSRAFAPRVAGLLMNRDRIMCLRINAIIIQELDECVPRFRLLCLDDIQVEYVTIPRQLCRQREVLRALQTRRVSGGPFTPVIVISSMCLSFALRIPHGYHRAGC